MMVCHCHRVTDLAVETVVASGATKVGQVVRATRAGTDCGGCIPLLRQVCASQVAAQRERHSVTCEEALTG